MAKHDRRISLWLALDQPVTYLGLGIAAFVISAALILINKAHNDAYKTAAQNSSNLARIFEGYTSRTIKSVDNSMRFLRASYQKDPERFDIAGWSNESDLQDQLVLEINLINKDGYIKASTYVTATEDIFVGDREHFRFHQAADRDTLFISKPLLLRTQGKWAIVISRPLMTSAGAFAGMITAAIDPDQLARSFSTLELGTQGIASLDGFDGIVRARGNGNGRLNDALGKSVANAEVFKRFGTEPSGTYWSPLSAATPVKRLISYRVVDGYPLIAVVGLSEHDIFKYSSQSASTYVLICCIILLAVLSAVILGTAREYKLLKVSHSLARANAEFETAVENIPLGLCLFDKDQKLKICNDRYGEMYGLSAEQLQPGTKLEEILQARVAAGTLPLGKQRDEYLESGRARAADPKPGYFIREIAGGRTYAIGLGVVPGGGWVAVLQDITAQKLAEAEITHLAHYDSLTALANRVLFLQHVNTATARCRNDGSAFAVHILDLDRFKEVNDTLGHACGDQLLRVVAQRLLTVVGENDIVARLGGDEFAILQPIGPAGGSSAEELAEKLLRAFADPFDIHEHKINVETSVGIALAPDNGDEAEQLLKTADLALYKAKSEGRNTYRMFQAEMEIEARSRHAMQIDLRHAIGAEQFELHYQPIVDAASQKPCGVEALVRWRHPIRGLVAPDKFIPLAEETGLIVPLGEWVLRTACRDAAQWPDHLKVAVNLSSVQFRNSDLKQIVDAALADSGLPPARLELEVTETVLLQNNQENMEILHRFRAMGISIALDDFGTGYSSLSYLQSFPFDKIKIDRSFVANLSSRADCAAIVSAVTGLARSLDIQTTAEGVETQEQVTLLRAAGCGQMQGYLFGRPRPKSELDFTGIAAGSAVA